MENLTPIKAIRAKCLDCSAGQYSEIKECPCKTCPLYVFRLGKNPNRKRQFSEEQKIAAAERMKKARLNRKLKDNG